MALSTQATSGLVGTRTVTVKVTPRLLSLALATGSPWQPPNVKLTSSER
jgi:hypothetical protein